MMKSDFAWSPDGSKIAFTSNHTKDVDQNENTDIFVVDTTDGAIPEQLTTWTGADGNPEWSPDGKWIAYLRYSFGCVIRNV